MQIIFSGLCNGVLIALLAMAFVVICRPETMSFCYSRQCLRSIRLHVQPVDVEMIFLGMETRKGLQT